jgi:hypothetical protein
MLRLVGAGKSELAQSTSRCGCRKSRVLRESSTTAKVGALSLVRPLIEATSPDMLPLKSVGSLPGALPQQTAAASSPRDLVASNRRMSRIGDDCDCPQVQGQGSAHNGASSLCPSRDCWSDQKLIAAMHCCSNAEAVHCYVTAHAMPQRLLILQYQGPAAS